MHSDGSRLCCKKIIPRVTQSILSKYKSFKMEIAKKKYKNVNLFKLYKICSYICLWDVDYQRTRWKRGSAYLKGRSEERYLAHNEPEKIPGEYEVMLNSIV